MEKSLKNYWILRPGDLRPEKFDSEQAMEIKASIQMHSVMNWLRLPRQERQPKFGNSSPKDDHKLHEAGPMVSKLKKEWEKLCTEEGEPVSESEYRNFLNLVDRRLIVANFDNWQISVIDPYAGVVEPAIGDYLKFFRSYLFFYSQGSPNMRRSLKTAFSFSSRLTQLVRRAFTRSLKPRHSLPDSSTLHATTPRSSNLTDTTCVPPQSGHSVPDN